MFRADVHRGCSVDGRRILSTQQLTAEIGLVADLEIPAGESKEIACGVDPEKLSLICISVSRTARVAFGGDAFDSNLVQNIPLLWTADDYHACPVQEPCDRIAIENLGDEACQASIRLASST